MVLKVYSSLKRGKCVRNLVERDMCVDGANHENKTKAQVESIDLKK